MDKVLLAIWVFISSLVGGNHSTPPPLAKVASLTPIAMPNTFIIKGSGTSTIVSIQGTPVPPLYFEKTITDPIAVQKLYSAMLALPPYPTPIKGSIPPSCGQGYNMDYQLNFFKDTKLIRQGTMTIHTCGGGMMVSLDGTYKREFYDQNNWKPFRTLLLNSLGVTASQFYGAKE